MAVALETTLKDYFGFSSFRSQQKDIIEHVLQKKDAVVLMPTGGGKSICYQLPALRFEGVTIVVSPLIALMKDQVQALRANGIPAAFLNSTLSTMEEKQTTKGLLRGEIKLLYISPERIFAKGFLVFMKKLKISLFAIDEAHCVSTWGHQFRPEYKRLDVLKETFPKVPVMALTATADRSVRSDIGELLGMEEPRFFIASFDRPNLSLSVMPAQKKAVQLNRLLKKYQGQSGIIYCNNRKATEQVATRLQHKGVKAKPYHAGMRTEERSKTQDEFLENKIDVVVATIAFGMGIDKPDVRFVIHNNMPANLEGYYQEIGRAGRDGKPADAVLFYSYRDVQKQLGFIDKITDGRYAKIQTAKLERIEEYCEAQTCRRKILLTYFSEIPEEDCNNCDVCKNPPDFFDGTEQAKKALKVLEETPRKIPVSGLVDTVKGTNSQQVKDKGLDKLKTFGIGNEETGFAWQMYVQQFVQQGIVEINYKENYSLMITDLGKQIMEGKKKVKLVTPETIKERQKKNKEKTEIVEVKEEEPKYPVDRILLARLKAVRKRFAGQLGQPAYSVFADETLKAICKVRPSNMQSLVKVEGVGQQKAIRFGNDILNVIADFQKEQAKKKKK